MAPKNSNIDLDRLGKEPGNYARTGKKSQYLLQHEQQMKELKAGQNRIRSVLDSYFSYQQQMQSITIYQAKETDILRYFKYGEKQLNILPEAIKAFHADGLEELPPTIYCRDHLPDVYMCYGKWDDAKRVLARCFECKAFTQEKYDASIAWLESCQSATQSVLQLISNKPGFLQKNIYKQLPYDDKEALQWVASSCAMLEKRKSGNTNALYLAGQAPETLPEDPNPIANNVPAKAIPAIALSQDSSLQITEKFPEWYICISFGYSTSANYAKAVFMAQASPLYLCDGENKAIIHQAIYGKDPQEYLAFIQLYELISSWKSTFVFINGKIIDRKIVGDLNYCYGDKCRSGNSSFCYGASIFTDNPFGCHRLQISRGNNPWWTYLTNDHPNNVEYHIDKSALRKRIDETAAIYSNCPAFDYSKIIAVLDSLPNVMSKKEYQTCLNKNNFNSTIRVNLATGDIDENQVASHAREYQQAAEATNSKQTAKDGSTGLKDRFKNLFNRN